MKKTVVLILVFILLCQLTGCLSLVSTEKSAMDYIDGDVQFEIRWGPSASARSELAETEVVIDKDKFVDLYNEYAQYNPNNLKNNTDGVDLKINPTQTEEWEIIHNSEINIRAIFDGGIKSVSVFEYDSNLYFFVLSLGNASEPDEVGSYYMKISDELSTYWEPVLEEIREDAEINHFNNYGSFTIDYVSSYDNKYTAKIDDAGDSIMILITSANINDTTSFTPCRKDDFYGICWENDNYNMWIQSGDIGVVCYSMENGKWKLNSAAVRPEYIVSKYDK